MAILDFGFAILDLRFCNQSMHIRGLEQFYPERHG
ncbi:hypothetical protein O77CONTIG1_02253 [Leptolyngbya sp. O-77]|nr:hypothetical protein O77CONTIG1_02253 [Leptolyngbya sp. O-77]